MSPHVEKRRKIQQRETSTPDPRPPAAPAAPATNTATIYKLPLELILHVSEDLSQADIAKLLTTCWHLNSRELTAELYSRDRKTPDGPNHAIRTACRNGDGDLLRRAVEHGADVDDYIQLYPPTAEDHMADLISPVCLAITSKHFGLACDLIKLYGVTISLEIPPQVPPDPFGRVYYIRGCAFRELLGADLPFTPGHQKGLSYLEEFLEADALFDLLLAQTNVSVHHATLQHWPLLRLAMHSLVPSHWFKKLLVDYNCPCRSGTNAPHGSIWLALIRALTSYDSGTRSATETGNASESACSFYEKLCVAREHCDIDTGRSEYDDAKWILHDILWHIMEQPDAELAVRIFGIVLSARDLNLNKRGRLGTKGPMTMLEGIAVEIPQSSGPNFSRTVQRNGQVMMEMLLSKGADPTIAAVHALSEDGGSLILTLAECGHSCVEPILESVLKHHLAAIEQQQRSLAVQRARARAKDSSTSALDELLNVKARNSDGKNALHLACQSEGLSPEVVRLLIRYGADPTARDNYGYTPLRDLCANAQAEDGVVLEVVSIMLGSLSLERQRQMLPSAGVWIDLDPARIAHLRGHSRTCQWLKNFWQKLYESRSR